jgi:hypothetical protein
MEKEEKIKIYDENCDGQQFHQYQQIKQLLLNIRSLNTKKDHNIWQEMQILAWNRHRNMAELNQLMGSQLSSS